MKFYDRKQEMETLKSHFSLIERKSVFIVLTGRRRIGKTRLIKESLKGRKYLDFFVPVKERGLILDEFSSEINEKLGYCPKFRSFDEFLGYLFSTQDNIVILFDEFQNMLKVDVSFMYSFQKYWDKFKDEKRFAVVITGSYIGTMKKIFQNKMAPLYGRADCFLKLQPLDYKTSFEIMDDLGVKNIEDKVRLYGILGGIPKYYEYVENIVDLDKSDFFGIVNELFVKRQQMLVYEGKNMLIEEFGKRYKMYFSINESISRGQNTLVQIANAIYQKPTTIMKHLMSLEDYFEIIKRRYPATDKISKKSRYKIDDYFLLFWFYFVYRNMRHFEENRCELVSKDIREQFNSYFGVVFEHISMEFLGDLNKKNKLRFRFDKIGGWWGHFRENNERKDIEIDVVALCDSTKDVGFYECKWQKLNFNQCLKILLDLKEKSKYVMWNNDKRNEYFGLVAKKIEGKDELRERGFDAWDIDDF